MEIETAFPIPSELVEPFAAMIVGRMWARCDEAKEKHGKASVPHQEALNRFWWALSGLERLAISIQTATHFSIAMNNHISGSAAMIEKELGFNPMYSDDANWKFR